MHLLELIGKESVVVYGKRLPVDNITVVVAHMGVVMEYEPDNVGG